MQGCWPDCFDCLQQLLIKVRAEGKLGCLGPGSLPGIRGQSDASTHQLFSMLMQVLGVMSQQMLADRSHSISYTGE